MATLRPTGRFWATGETGRRYMVTIYTEYTDVTTRGDKTRDELEGPKQYVLDTGQRVNRIEKGKYRVVQTGETVHSDDPAAP